MNLPRDIADRLIARREALGLSQEKVAQRINMSGQTVGRIERCETEPKIETLVKLARALETTVAYLIGETEYPDRAPDRLPATGTDGRSN